MSAFYEMRECDVISVTYEAHPSFHLSWSVDGNVCHARSQVITVLSRSSEMTYENIDGETVTGSTHLSGAARYAEHNLTEPFTGFTLNPASSSLHTIYRLRTIYEKNSFERSEIWSTSSFWQNVLNPISFTGSVIDIPQVLYGEEIKRNSVRILISNNSFSGEFIDDGYGALVTSSVDVNNYQEVINNLYGVVFYNHGIILTKYFSYIGFGSPPTYVDINVDCHFSGTNKIPMNMYVCSTNKSDGNFSLNPSFVSFVSSSNKNEITTRNPKTFITGIGLYDENYDLIGVAKLATPVLNEEKSSITFKLKLNF